MEQPFLYYIYKVFQVVCLLVLLVLYRVGFVVVFTVLSCIDPEVNTAVLFCCRDMFSLPNKAGAEAVLYFLFSRLNPTLCRQEFRFVDLYNYK